VRVKPDEAMHWVTPVGEAGRVHRCFNSCADAAVVTSCGDGWLCVSSQWESLPPKSLRVTCIVAVAVPQCIRKFIL
jgi:hypothetical protein